MGRYFIVLLFAAMIIVDCRHIQPNSNTISHTEATTIVSGNHDNDSCRIYPYKYLFTKIQKIG